MSEQNKTTNITGSPSYTAPVYSGNPMLNAVPNMGKAAFNVASNSAAPSNPPTEPETFENPQTEKLIEFAKAYKRGMDEACVGQPANHDLTESREEYESRCCNAIFSSAKNNGMSLSVAYGMAYMAAKHFDGSLQ